MIDILYLIYPNMVGLMSQLSAVRVGEHPFFEDAMSRKNSNPIWGVLTDEQSVDTWLEGLKGRGNRLYVSVSISEPDKKPNWCDGMDWKDCILKLISKADKAIIIEQSKNNYLYDQILLGPATQAGQDALVSAWHKLDEFCDDIELSGDIKERINIEALRNKNNIEMLYRRLGVRLLMQRHVPRNDKVTGEKVQETLKRDEARFFRSKKRGGPIPKGDFIPFIERFAVAVSAHPAYEHRLPALLDEWDRQIGDLPVKKFLLYDHPDVPEVKEGWQILSPEQPHRNPAPLRNAVLEFDVDWIQYWDADNTPVQNHFKPVMEQAYWVPENVGLIYHETIGGTGDKLEIPKDLDPRRGYYIDTASCWRKEAILSAGCWQSGLTVEDWALARDIYLAGWKFEKSSVLFKWEDTEDNRTSGSTDAQAKWEAKDYAIVILFRGDDDLLERVKSDFENLIVPPHCGLTIVTDGDEEFHRKMYDWLIQNPKNDRFERKTVFRARPQNCPIKGGEEFLKIHAHVADLYARALRTTPEELILTWEDDVRPEPEAFRALSDQIIARNDVAAVGAPYLIRENTYMAAARGKDYWEEPLLMSDVTEEPMTVGMVAGGFTLYNRLALNECPLLGPFNVLNKHGFLGWDGFLCKRMNEAGWNIQLCGKSKVEHLPKH